jgi:hypothetical protein
MIQLQELEMAGSSPGVPLDKLQSCRAHGGASHTVNGQKHSKTVSKKPSSSQFYMEYPQLHECLGKWVINHVFAFSPKAKLFS